MYRLPDDLRDVVKQPIGKVLDEKSLLSFVETEEFVVSVGDVVTSTLLKNNFQPAFCVVDYKTRRGECSDEVVGLIKSFGDQKIKVKNPAGCISDELWDAIKYVYENIDSGSFRIEVEGEEDLASLAAIYLAPSEVVTIIYGLPDKGVLAVKANQRNKQKVKKVLDKM